MLQYEHPVVDDTAGPPSWARERASMLQGLYVHIVVYVIINAGLFGINWLTRSADGPWWFIWPLMGWGLGLVIHIATTVLPVFSDHWVDRKADRLSRRR